MPGVGDCASIGVASAEECDGRDNDCDERTDEALDTACGSPSRGICRMGLKRCVAGQWSPCEGAVEPLPEVCDAAVQDENCNGVGNEGCPCTPGETRECGIERGICKRGVNTCTAQAQWSSDCVGEAKSAIEVCDGMLDEDCDGRIDNGCECTNGAAESCIAGRGICEPGMRVCANGRFGSCQGMAKPQKELCDGRPIDEDCDGDPDNGCACKNGETAPCDNAGAGVCSKGNKTCADGQWGACTSITPKSTERCDGLDNDCDGVTDSGAACSSGTRCVNTVRGYECVQCERDGECASKHCLNTRCVDCVVAEDCSAPGDCKEKSCNISSGKCEPTALPPTTICQNASSAPGVCMGGTCSVRIVALQSMAGAGTVETADGQWVVDSCGSDGRSLCASASSASSAAQFALVNNAADNTVALWSLNARKYVSIAFDAGEDLHLRAVSDWNQDWEHFYESGGPSNYSLKSKANGNYVGAQDTNAKPPFVLLADAFNGIGAWERFRLVDCPNGSCR